MCNLGDGWCPPHCHFRLLLYFAPSSVTLETKPHSLPFVSYMHHLCDCLREYPLCVCVCDKLVPYLNDTCRSRRYQSLIPPPLSTPLFSFLYPVTNPTASCYCVTHKCIITLYSRTSRTSRTKKEREKKKIMLKKKWTSRAYVTKMSVIVTHILYNTYILI